MTFKTNLLSKARLPPQSGKKASMRDVSMGQCKQHLVEREWGSQHHAREAESIAGLDNIGPRFYINELVNIHSASVVSCLCLGRTKILCSHVRFYLPQGHLGYGASAVGII